MIKELKLININMKKIVIASVFVTSFVFVGIASAEVPPTDGSGVGGNITVSNSTPSMPPVDGSGVGADIVVSNTTPGIPPTDGSGGNGGSVSTTETNTVITNTTNVSSGGSRSGGRRSVAAPVGQVLGAETVNWNSLSASQKAEMIKTLQAMLAEIIKTMNELIADGTLK